MVGLAVGVSLFTVRCLGTPQSCERRGYEGDGIWGLGWISTPEVTVALRGSRGPCGETGAPRDAITAFHDFDWRCIPFMAVPTPLPSRERQIPVTRLAANGRRVPTHDSSLRCTKPGGQSPFDSGFESD